MNNKLIDKVIEQIKADVEFPCNDMTALEEMLSFLPEKVLLNYLPEED